MLEGVWLRGVWPPPGCLREVRLYLALRAMYMNLILASTYLTAGCLHFAVLMEGSLRSDVGTLII